MNESEASLVKPNSEFRLMGCSLRTLLVCVTICAVLCGFLLVPILFLRDMLRSRPMSVEEARRIFAENTGIAWPDDASDIHVSNQRVGIPSPYGHFYVVFSLPPEVLKKWLRSEAPWAKRVWLRGPVPPIIGINCSFGCDGRIGRRDEGCDEYEGNSEILLVLKSNEVWYSARDRGGPKESWFSGDLLLIDPRTCVIRYGNWDG